MLWCCCVAAPVMAAGPMPVAAGGLRRAAEISAWERAERVRDAFEAEPEASRTRAGYARAMEGYRAIYHETPQDMHAAEAVNAVAELLAEQGRGERDARLLRAAIGQYEFLRGQYPGSSLRVGALLAEAQIERNDLHDAAAARERYGLLLKQHPRSALAEQARAGLLSLNGGSAAGRDAGAASGGSVSGALESRVAGGPPAGAVAGRGADGQRVGEQVGVREQVGRQQVGVREGGAGGVPAQGRLDGQPGSSPGDAAMRPAGAPGESPGAVAAPVVRRTPPRVGPPAMVTGIRHWSTPSYTRVAIDVGDAVEYEAARVPGPDRIYFDLHGARLAPELVGKSFAVTDDGFLKRIRVAQTGGDFARIVLDVNDVTEYSAFLLPNPYRLIIDIHGRSKGPATMAMMDAPAKPCGGRAEHAGGECGQLERCATAE